MHFGQAERFEVQALNFYDENACLARFVASHDPTFEEFTVLMLAIVPQLQPGFFSKIIAEHFPEGGDFPEFGGVKATNHRGILPTGETAQFILAGDDLEKRLDVQRILGSEHWFAQKQYALAGTGTRRGTFNERPFDSRSGNCRTINHRYNHQTPLQHGLSGGIPGNRNGVG